MEIKQLFFLKKNTNDEKFNLHNKFDNYSIFTRS